MDSVLIEMKLFDDFAATALALLISAVSAVLAALLAYVSLIFIGAKLFNDEASYGVPLSLGPQSRLLLAQ
jgi:hypothetical protein